jgi:hypothetical protein
MVVLRGRRCGKQKRLMPEDAKEAIGHGIRANRSKSGAVSFDVQAAEVRHAVLYVARPSV